MSALHEALEKIYLERQQQIFTCALAVTRCPSLAEDAIQEAFQRLFRLNHEPRDLRSYVLRSVRNAAVDQLRRSPPTEPLDGAFIFDPDGGPREAAAEREFLGRVAEAFEQLPDEERETMAQHLYTDLTFREIAEIQDTPEGTVTTWYYRGLKRLRDALEE